MKRICVDPGHGGKFNGASAIKDGGLVVKEKDINLKASKMLVEALILKGLMAYSTRDDDRNLGETLNHDLRMRVVAERYGKADAFISVHCNAFSDPSVYGFEVWTSVGETGADPLAESIYNAVKSGVSPRMRSDMEDGDHDREKHLYVLKHTKCPAVLLELGFMPNEEDLRRLMDHDYLKKMMDNVASGIEAWVYMV